jgi:vacuolar-type H+-ATPase subunit E/Vma4
MSTAVPLDRSASDATRLADLIRDAAATEAAAAHVQAHTHGQGIAEEAAREVDTWRAAARREGEERGNREAAKVLSSAETAGRHTELWDREALINEVLQRARVKLEQFPSLPGADTFLVGLIEEALHALPDEEARVLLPTGYGELLDAPRRARLDALHKPLHYEYVEVPGGGVIVETVDGRLRFDNSFPARMTRLMSRLRRVAADALLAAEDAPTRP